RSHLLCRWRGQGPLRNRSPSHKTLRITGTSKETGDRRTRQGADTLAQREARVPSMTAQDDVTIVGVPAGKRAGLEWILEESFEGWYLMHSKRTLRDVEVVRAAMSSGKPVGLVMLK